MVLLLCVGGWAAQAVQASWVGAATGPCHGFLPVAVSRVLRSRFGLECVGSQVQVVGIGSTKDLQGCSLMAYRSVSVGCTPWQHDSR